MNTLLKRNVWIFGALAAGLLGLFVARSGGGFPLDDSWIHQAYGRNLGTYGEWALVRGQPSAASTAPLYTVLLAVGYALRIPYLLWTHLLGALALWGIAWAGARLAQAMMPQARYVGLWVGGLLLVTWQLVWAAASGMETALFALWSLVLPLWTMRARTHTHPLEGALFGVVCGLVVLTRPEGALLIALCGLALLASWQNPLRAWAWMAAALVGFALCLAPYGWLNYTLTGGILPTTSAAKQAQFAPLLALPLPVRVWRMFFPLMLGGQVLLLVGVGVYIGQALRTTRKARAELYRWILPLWVIGLLLLYALRLPASYQHGRYVLPALPALVVMGSMGTLHWVNRWRHQPLTRILSRSTALGAVGIGVAMTLGLAPSIYARDVAVINQEMVAAARWVDANVPTSAFMAIHDIGAVAYFTPRPMLDIAGLVSPEVIPIINDTDALWNLMQARDVQYLMAFPDQIPGENPQDPRLCEVFRTDGTVALSLGAENMAVYALNWQGLECP